MVAEMKGAAQPCYAHFCREVLTVITNECQGVVCRKQAHALAVGTCSHHQVLKAAC